MELTDIIEEVKRKLHDKVRDNSLIALAFTGSRAGGFNKNDSDYDFFAVYDSDINLHFKEYIREDTEICVAAEDKNIFESGINQSISKYHEQTRFVWMPYIPLEGEKYLAEKEKGARKILLSRFIESLPVDCSVKIHPERIAEYPLIKMTLSWPVFMRRLKAISISDNNFLRQMTEKYSRILEEEGYPVNKDETYILINKKKKGKENYLLKEIILKVKDYLNHKENRTIKRHFQAASFMLSQSPELIINRFYKFPRFKKEGDYLEYTGPTLAEFVSSRDYINLLRKFTDKIKPKTHNHQYEIK